MKKMLFYCTLVFSSSIAISIFSLTHVMISGTNEDYFSISFLFLFVLILIIGLILSAIEIYKKKK